MTLAANTGLENRYRIDGLQVQGGMGAIQLSDTHPQAAARLPGVLINPGGDDRTETAYGPILLAAAPPPAPSTILTRPPIAGEPVYLQKWGWAILVIVVMAAGAGLMLNSSSRNLALSQSTVTPTPTPTASVAVASPGVVFAAAAPSPVPSPTLAPIAPLVLQAVPEKGAEQPLDAPIVISFDQPMERASVEKALAIEPSDPVDGTFEWVDDQTLRFAFKDGFARGERYKLRIVETATSQAGLPMLRPFELNFSAAGFLEVVNTQPLSDTNDVLADTTVTVSFNRPVIPLGATQNLPDPLTFTPPVAGRGEWLNTSVYQFTPAAPGFAPATDYVARVSAGLTDVTGQAVLENDYEWRFSTISPAVVGSIPANNDLYVSPSPLISVTFNQKMDRPSVAENLIVVNEATGQPIPGQLAWADTGILPPPPVDEYGNILPMTDELGNPLYDQSGQPIPPPLEPVGVETVVFTPAEPLVFGATYQISLPKGVKGQLAGTTTQTDYQAAFTVTPYPAVDSTFPANGEQFADPYQGLDITFTGPINRNSVVVGQTLRVEPEIDPTEVYTYWRQYDSILSVSFPRQPNRAYTVTLTTGVEGRYGQPLKEDASISWQTLNAAPYVYLVGPSIALYNGYLNQTYIYMTVRNVSQVNFALYRLSQDEFMQLSTNVFAGWDDYNQWQEFVPDGNKLVGEWSQPTNPEVYTNYVYKVDVSQAIANGQPLPPGLYLLDAYAPASSLYPEAQNSDITQSRDRQILIVSKRNITLKQGAGDGLVWLTDLQSGQPVAGKPVSVIGSQDSGLPSTGADGLVNFTFFQPVDEPPVQLTAFAGTPDRPDDDFAVGSSTWTAGLSPYEFDNLYGSEFTGFRYTGSYNGYVYTDRPLYRPGQEVYFKAVIRADDDANYSLPPIGDTAQVQIYDGMYRQVYSDTLSLNGWGTLDGGFKLGDKAGLGAYSLQVMYEGITFYGSFQVAAYRKPEFLVNAITDKTDYRQGETINITVDAEFFAGGPVSNAAVRWTLLSDPYAFRYQGEGYYNFVDYDDLRYRPDQYYAGYGERIAAGDGTTDAAGRFTFAVPADIANRLASQMFTFDVVVTDINNQEVATQARAIVHKGDFYVGLRPQSYVGQVGVDNPIDVLVVDWDSQPVAGQEVELIAAEYNWYSVQQLDPAGTGPEPTYYWENLVEDVAVFTTTVTTGPDGQAVANFGPQKAGNYKIYARAVDPQGQEVRSATYLWVSGDAYVNWGQENNDRIELVTDQREYQVGDTATILVPHPFSGTVTALVTLERGHIYQQYLTEFKTNSDQLQIPITEDLIPNMYVSVVVVKGMDSASSTPPVNGDSPPPTPPVYGGGSGGGLPGFRLGYVRLPVAPTEKELSITLTPTPPASGEVYQPGDEVEYQISVTNSQGQPVKAELSLALIDKAVLTLAPLEPDKLLDAFWFERQLGVQTASSLTLAQDRINQSLDEKKGGGGGEGMMGPESVRQNFADTALWVADFVTDEQGQGSITAPLPDNLTTWVLISQGVTGGDTRVGESRIEVISSKPLLVRPVTPRFLVRGDEAVLGVIVQNNSATAQEAEVSFTAEGLEIRDWRLPATCPPDGGCAGRPGENGSWQTGPSPVVKVQPGERVKVEYQVKTDNAEAARLTMGAKSAGYSDALAFELPIYHLSTPETAATVGMMAEDGTRIEGVALPPLGSFDPTQGDLTVQVDPSLAAGMQSGLTFLENYPYQCTEQTVSSFLPNIFTYRAYDKLGLAPPNPMAADLVNQGLQQLYSQQQLDGGWSWCGPAESNPNLTAYVLLGLVEARRAGFGVDQSVVDSAVAYLQASLVAPNDIAAPWQGNQQAFVLYALAEAGSGDFGRSAALFERREMMDIFGRAFLAMGMHLLDPEAGQIDTLLADITDLAIVSATGAHWEEATVDYYAMNTDTRSTAIVVAALSRIQPPSLTLPSGGGGQGGGVLPNAVRWLMSIRTNGGHWETTQENAWAIIGLTDWLVASGELAADYTWAASLNGADLGQGQADNANLTQTTQLQVAVADLLADAVNRLAFERDSTADEAGNLYYAAYLTTYRPVAQVKALDRGLTVYRQYFLETPTPPSPSEGAGQGGGPITEAKVGDYVQVKLTLIAPNDLHYVMVEDPFPAGMEGVDSSLATTSIVGQPPQNPAGVWQEQYFSHTELRDDKAVLFANFLPKGTHEYTYTLRASTPGTFRVIPTHVEQMYFPEVFGRSDGGLFRVNE